MAHIITTNGEKVGHKYYATITGAIADAEQRLRPEKFGTVLQVHAGETHTHDVMIQADGPDHSEVVITEYWPSYSVHKYSAR